MNSQIQKLGDHHQPPSYLLILSPGKRVLQDTKLGFEADSRVEAPHSYVSGLREVAYLRSDWPSSTCYQRTATVSTGAYKHPLTLFRMKISVTNSEAD